MFPVYVHEQYVDMFWRAMASEQNSIRAECVRAKGNLMANLENCSEGESEREREAEAEKRKYHTFYSLLYRLFQAFSSSLATTMSAMLNC